MRREGSRGYHAKKGFCVVLWDQCLLLRRLVVGSDDVNEKIGSTKTRYFNDKMGNDWGGKKPWRMKGGLGKVLAVLGQVGLCGIEGKVSVV